MRDGIRSGALHKKALRLPGGRTSGSASNPSKTTRFPPLGTANPLRETQARPVPDSGTHRAISPDSFRRCATVYPRNRAAKSDVPRDGSRPVTTRISRRQSISAAVPGEWWPGRRKDVHGRALSATVRPATNRRATTHDGCPRRRRIAPCGIFADECRQSGTQRWPDCAARAAAGGPDGAGDERRSRAQRGGIGCPTEIGGLTKIGTTRLNRWAGQASIPAENHPNFGAFRVSRIVTTQGNPEEGRAPCPPGLGRV